MVALVALGLMAAYAIGTISQGGVFASPSAQTTINAQTTAPNSQQNGTGTTTNNQSQQPTDNKQKLLNAFMTNFTSRLGVDEAKLNSAFTGAVNSTADQAVRDGLVTQAEADKVKGMAQSEGFRGLVTNGFASGEDRAPGNPGDEYANPKMALMQTMNSIGVSADDMQRGFQAGKSLVDLAREHNVDAATLKNKILQNYRSQLDTAVHNGKLTQAQADERYDAFAGQVDDIINGKGNGVRVNKDGYNSTIDAPTEAAERAAWNAAPPILGMQAADMKMAMGDEKKSLSDLARSKNVDPQRLHDAMLHTGKAELDKAVADKTLTQAQADTDYRKLTAWVDGLMNQGIN